MAEGDFSIKATISANTSQFEQGMKNAQNSLSNVSKSIDGVSKLLKSAFSVVGITASVGAVINFGKNAVAAADSANKQFNILSNTIKATGASAWTSTEELDKMAKDYAKATNYSVGQIEDMQSVLLGFRNITGKTFGDASDAIMDMATVMGMDLKSATQTVGKALDDPVKGLDSLRRQGFAFTEEQKMELEQLVRNGKQLEAQKIILDELATTYGGAAKAGVSATNAWQYSITNLTETIGNKLMPYVKESSNIMAKFADSIAEGLNTKSFDMVVNSIKLILETGSKIVKMFVEPFIKGIQDITNEFSKLDIESYFDVFDGVIGVIKFAFDEIISIIKYTFNNMKRSVTYFVEFFNSGFVKRIKDIVLQVVDMIVFLYQQIKGIFSQIIAFIQQKQDELINSISNATKSFFNLDAFFDGIEEALNSTFRMFQDLINGVKALFSGDFSLALDYGKLALYRLADTWMTSISTILNSMPNLVNGVINGINKIIEGINKVREWMGQDQLGLIDAFESVDLSQSLGIDEKIDELERKIKEKTGSAADYSIKEIKRTTKAFSGATKEIILQVTETKGAVEDASKNASNAVVKNLTNAEKKTTFFRNFKKNFDKSLNGISAGFSKLKEDIEKDANDWSDVVSTSYNAIKNAGTQMFESIGEGLVEGGKGFEDYATVAVDAIAQVLQALGAQLLAMAAAAALRYDFASAAIGTAAAAAALVASGTLSGLASSMKSAADSSKEASKYITSVGEAARGTYLSLNEFLNKVQSIKESFEGSSTSVMQSAIDSKKLYNDAVKSLRNYKNELFNVENEIKAYYVTYRSLEYARRYDEASNVLRMIELLQIKAYKLRQDISSYESTVEQLKKHYENVFYEGSELLKQQINNNKELINSYNELYQAVEKYGNYSGFKRSFLYFEQFSSIQNEFMSFYENLSKTASTISDELFSAISEKTSKKDFLKNIRDYIRKNLLQISIYTEEFQRKLANIGVDLSTSLMSNGKGLSQIRSDIESLWSTASTKANQVDKILSEVFGDISDSIEDAEESLSSFEEAMKNFFESISDLGGDIASNIIDGLENGLTQGEFLENMKKWIRNMLIQTVVYTETMKNEIEAIGKTISEGLSKGFTETNLHEIRRDLSYIFNEANKTMVGLDSVLDNVFSGYANGTQNATSGLHLVGEAGPELVRFRGGEQVLNAQNTQAALEGAGGNTNNFNVTFNNLQDTSAYAMMNQLREYNREMAINGVI